MLMRTASFVAALTLPIALAAVPAAAQETVPPQGGEYAREPAPTITGSASSDVKFVPDRATVRISVQTRASTAAAAAADNASKQNAVLNSLRSLGLPNEQLSTAGYSVTPEYRYQPNQAPTLVGYTVTNTIVADVRDLKLLGKVLDAALTNGANLISSLDFYASNTDAARRQAVSDAVAKARAEAEVAARAAGGQLGTLLSLNISGGNQGPPPPRPMMMAARAGAESTPINPGEQTLTVSVYASWHFLPTK
jgi:uncharacterized protein YggE